jgi:2,4-dienoyl-CoA reductase [(3E)-enoyl-CoA-producing], peroxisomal
MEVDFFTTAMPNTLGPDYLRECVYKPDIFSGKVVFVTGGAGSICRVQAEAMVLLGANAVILGRRSKETEEAAREIQTLRRGSRVLGLGNVDVRSVESLKTAVERTIAQLGRIDYVIAGAAGNFLCDINNLSSNAFKTVIEIDLLGSYNTFKVTSEELKKNKGSIIFVSATLHYRGLMMQAHASAAKAGVDALNNVIAVEYGPLGVRSNCLAPGPIEGTEGMSRLAPSPEIGDPKTTVPLLRNGSTTEIANSTVFLFSNAASYITGTTLVVDGGNWHIGNLTPAGFYPDLIVSANEVKTKL